MRSLSLTPLIDVIFLLLLFFMLSSTFSRFSEVPLSGASGEAVTQMRTKILLRVQADSVMLNNQPTDLDNLAQTLYRLQQQQEGENLMLLISLGPEANSQQLLDIMVQTRKLDNLPIAFIRGR